ncbi:outer membrane protein assembly factor BamC [Alcanivorax sp. JB21]|uniref:outer membrane protein assembly factor BamC n=1 Tax=Alcanivorax limicola TaxID=2874102 RepID=UPI001CBF4D77|nr:outer membrane protein assembly factor BamC [Alcanivorax limicola]MBZ2189912.1 outer membrane protein assembly factor BamC [Alcanivorax limicola]
MRYFSVATLSAMVAVVLSSGCSWIPDRTLVYQEAETSPRMDVPEGMFFSGFQDGYPIPDVDQRVTPSSERFRPPPPPQLAILGQQDSAEAAAASVDPGRLSAIMGRDGNGYPIIMLSTQFVWAWEYVGQALARTDLTIEDRNRESGIYYVRVPRSYGLEERQAQLKLSHTVNGIQVAVLDRRGTALVAREPGQAILERLNNEF